MGHYTRKDLVRSSSQKLKEAATFLCLTRNPIIVFLKSPRKANTQSQIKPMKKQTSLRVKKTKFLHRVPIMTLRSIPPLLQKQALRKSKASTAPQDAFKKNKIPLSINSKSSSVLPKMLCAKKYTKLRGKTERLSHHLKIDLTTRRMNHFLPPEPIKLFVLIKQK